MDRTHVVPSPHVALGWLVLGLVVSGCSTSSNGATPTYVPNQTTPQAATNAAASPVAATSAAVPVIKPGEKWIVHHEFDGQRVHLWLVRPDGSGDHELLPGFTGEAIHPDWSPDGNRIAYVADNDVFVVDTRGRHRRRVFDCRKACVFADYPAWSPQGDEILVMSADEVNGQVPHSVVQAVDVTTGRQRVLFTTTGPEYASYPRWSPDGNSVVTGLQRFATTRADDCVPSSSTVAVVDLGHPHPALQRLTDPAMFADYPDWSPDGSTLVFTTYDLGSRDAGCLADPTPASDLYTIRPDGSGLTQLTHNPTGPTLVRSDTASGPLSSQPTWSPDGSRIFYVQVSGDTWPGWTMASIAPDGSDLRSATGTTYLEGTHPRLRP